MFCEKGILKNFVKFKEKYLCWSLLFNKVADARRQFCQTLHLFFASLLAAFSIPFLLIGKSFCRVTLLRSLRLNSAIDISRGFLKFLNSSFLPSHNTSESLFLQIISGDLSALILFFTIFHSRTVSCLIFFF